MKMKELIPVRIRNQAARRNREIMKATPGLILARTMIPKMTEKIRKNQMKAMVVPKVRAVKQKTLRSKTRTMEQMKVPELLIITVLILPETVLRQPV